MKVGIMENYQLVQLFLTLTVVLIALSDGSPVTLNDRIAEPWKKIQPGYFTEYEIELIKRKGGSGGGHSGGGSSGGHSGGESEGGTETGGSSSSGSSGGTGNKSSSNSGSEPKSGSNSAPPTTANINKPPPPYQGHTTDTKSVGGYYYGGSTRSYNAGYRSYGGISPFLYPASRLFFFPVFLTYGQVYDYSYSFDSNGTYYINCLCRPLLPCSCDRNNETSYFQHLPADHAKVFTSPHNTTYYIDGSLNGTEVNTSSDLQISWQLLSTSLIGLLCII